MSSGSSFGNVGWGLLFLLPDLLVANLASSQVKVSKISVPRAEDGSWSLKPGLKYTALFYHIPLVKAGCRENPDFRKGNMDPTSPGRSGEIHGQRAHG